VAREGNREGSTGSALRFVGVGFELVVPLLVGVYGGYKLDGWLGTEPWLLIVGSVLGMAAGFLNFFRAVLPRKGGRTGEGNGS
jgi:ATP synthase protein I